MVLLFCLYSLLVCSKCLDLILDLSGQGGRVPPPSPHAAMAQELEKGVEGVSQRLRAPRDVQCSVAKISCF